MTLFAVGGIVGFLLIVGVILLARRGADKGFMSDIKLRDKSELPLNIILVEAELAGILPIMIAAFEDAIPFWNDSTQLNLVTELGGLGEGSDIIVSAYPENYDKRETAFATYFEDTSENLSFIYVDPDKISNLEDPEEVTTLAMEHEIGHALRLDHDDLLESIMFRKNRVRDAKVTDKDRELLRSVYGDASEE